MALDRQDIVRKDFPIGRRGYDPAAVDLHLRHLADEVSELGPSPRKADSLATAASERVRAIVEAAETTSADIQRQADDDANAIREQAQAAAERTRSDAAAQAQEHVANVAKGARAMQQRLEAMDSELGTLMESLRTGANGLTADLTQLQGNMGELRAVSEQSERGTPMPEPALAEEAPAEEAGAPDLEPELAREDAEPELEPELDEPAAAPAGDSEGARLTALNMALDGTPREETDRYLAENFELDDRDALLDEVYARVS